VATGREDGHAAIWDFATGARLFELPGHDKFVWSLAFSPDGTRLAVTSGDYATGAKDNQTAVWDVRTGKQISTFTGHDDLVWCVAFSPDGSRVASGSRDGARVWDPNTGREVVRLGTEGDPVMSLCFRPDGRQVASGLYSGTTVIWDTATTKMVHRLQGAMASVDALAFAPDSRRLVTVSRDDGALRTWDVGTGKELLAIAASPARRVEFSPDGTRLCLAGGRGITVYPAFPATVTPDQIEAYKRERYQRWVAENAK
jgi:WD40 repeat protein